MTNVRCKGNREIDILAINPKTQEKLHVESRVTTSFKLRLEATYAKDGKCHRNGLDYFQKEKFEHPYVKEKISQVFGDSNYEKVLVIWGKQNDFKDLEKAAKEKYDIRLLRMTLILASLVIRPMGRKHPRGSRDDVSRMLELMTLGFDIRYGKHRTANY